MKEVRLIFKHRNLDYSQQYADQYYEGKESVNNQKYLLLKFQRLESEKYTIQNHKQYTFEVIDKIGKETNIILQNVKILELVNGTDKLEIIVSKGLIERVIRKDEPKYNLTRIYFYFDPNKKYKKLDDFLYLLLEDLPAEFL